MWVKKKLSWGVGCWCGLCENKFLICFFIFWEVEKKLGYKNGDEKILGEQIKMWVIKVGGGG